MEPTGKSKPTSASESQQEKHAAPDDLVIAGVQVCKKGEMLTAEEFGRRCQEGFAEAFRQVRAKNGTK